MHLWAVSAPAHSPSPWAVWGLVCPVTQGHPPGPVLAPRFLQPAGAVWPLVYDLFSIQCFGKPSDTLVRRFPPLVPAALRVQSGVPAASPVCSQLCGCLGDTGPPVPAVLPGPSPPSWSAPGLGPDPLRPGRALVSTAALSRTTSLRVTVKFYAALLVLVFLVQRFSSGACWLLFPFE